MLHGKPQRFLNYAKYYGRRGGGIKNKDLGEKIKTGKEKQSEFT